MLSALVIFLLVGVFILTRGLRRIPIDDHPLCRACGFDLTGKPETSHHCPECGSDLTRAKATTIGHRRRRPAAIAIGLLLTLLSTAGVTLFLIASAKTFDIYNYYPDWLLAQSLDSPNARTRGSAARELIARISADNVSAGRMNSIADRILALQADTKTPWYTGWGDVIETILARGKLSDERARAYATNAISFQLNTRPRVRIGDSLFFTVTQLPPRIATGTSLLFNYENKQVTIDDLQRDWYGDSKSISSINRIRIGPGVSGFPMLSIVNIPQAIARLKPGPTTLRATRRLAVAQSTGSGRAFVLDTTITLSAPLTLLPPDEPSVALVPDPSLEERIRNSIRTISADFRRSYEGLIVNLQMANPPANVGFDIFVLHDGHETKIGSITCAKGKSAGGRSMVAPIHELSGDTIAIELRPSIEPATETLDTFEIWDGKIRLEDIPLRKPATRPAPTSRPPSKKAFSL